MHILYLDTNHLSELARGRAFPRFTPLVQLLEAGDAALAFGLMHLYELSHPDFRDRSTVGAFLDDVPKKWAVHLPALFDREIVAIRDRVFANGDGVPKVFHSTAQDAWDMPNNAAIPTSEMLDVHATRPTLRKKVTDTATYGSLMDHLKLTAAVVQHPELPLALRVRDMAVQGMLELPATVDAKAFIDKAGGLASFPAYYVYQQLHLGRLRDRKFTPEKNDVIDEWHACYSPYATVSAVDRRTLGRCVSARLAHIERITRTLTDVAPMVHKFAGMSNREHS